MRKAGKGTEGHGSKPSNVIDMIDAIITHVRSQWVAHSSRHNFRQRSFPPSTSCIAGVTTLAILF